MIDPTKVDVKVEESEQQYNVSASDTNIPVRVDVAEDSTQENVSVSDENIPMKMETETEIVSGIVDTYEGPYHVTPSTEEQTLPTRGLNMEENVVIDPVPPTPPPVSQIHVGTTAEWDEQPELVGELEHIYVYTDYSTVNGNVYPGIKIGDGETLLTDLPFAKGADSFQIISLGEFDFDDYDWDIEAYLNSLVSLPTGIYTVVEINDGFHYFISIEKIGNCIYQEWWYTEEGGSSRQFRAGFDWEGEGEYEFGDIDNWISSNTAWNSFAGINHTHDIEETVNQSNINNYFNTFDLNKKVGNYKIINSYDKAVYYLEYDYRYVSGLSGSYRFYQRYYNSKDSYIRQRWGTRSGNSIVWETWQLYDTSANIFDDIENNYYTMDQVDDLLEGFAPENMISTTWANLVSLRDSGKLTSGAYYRITDYNFVTSKLGVQSGNHQFDIVVLAISESMLSETAYAVRHAGDHYFEREVTEGGIEWLYSIYVDEYAENYGDEPVNHADDIHSVDVFCYSNYLEHPNTGDVVPVLYKTNSEEYDFDDPDYEDAYFYDGTYELDGDEYDMWSKWETDGNDWTFMQQYALTPIVVDDGEFIVSPIPETKAVPVNMNAWELKYCLDNDKELFGWADTNGKGVIYYMKDEFGNEAPYDFKNVTYARRYVSAVSNSVLNQIVGQYVGEVDYYAITTTAQTKYFYTYDDGTGADASLFGDASYNSIDTYIIDGQKQLSDIVTHYAHNSHFKPNTHGVTVAMACNSNDFEGENCLFCSGNSLKGFFRYCTMYGASEITAEGALRESIGYQTGGIKTHGTCYDLNFGTSLANSEFGGGCSGITFGNYCNNIKIGSNCSTITFGNYCINIAIGSNCNTITFTNYWRLCEIMDSCSKVNMQTSFGNTSNYCQFVTVRKNVTNVNLTPTRKLTYETIYYKTGKTETAV